MKERRNTTIYYKNSEGKGLWHAVNSDDYMRIEDYYQDVIHYISVIAKQSHLTITGVVENVYKY